MVDEQIQCERLVRDLITFHSHQQLRGDVSFIVFKPWMIQDDILAEVPLHELVSYLSYLERKLEPKDIAIDEPYHDNVLKCFTRLISEQSVTKL